MPELKGSETIESWNRTRPDQFSYAEQKLCIFLKVWGWGWVTHFKTKKTQQAEIYSLGNVICTPLRDALPRALDWCSESVVRTPPMPA